MQFTNLQTNFGKLKLLQFMKRLFVLVIASVLVIPVLTNTAIAQTRHGASL